MHRNLFSIHVHVQSPEDRLRAISAGPEVLQIGMLQTPTEAIARSRYRVLISRAAMNSAALELLSGRFRCFDVVIKHGDR